MRRALEAKDEGKGFFFFFWRIDRKVSVFFLYAGRHFPMTCNEA